jgi:hypothetical protein
MAEGKVFSKDCIRRAIAKHPRITAAGTGKTLKELWTEWKDAAETMKKAELEGANPDEVEELQFVTHCLGGEYRYSLEIEKHLRCGGR